MQLLLQGLILLTESDLYKRGGRGQSKIMKGKLVLLVIVLSQFYGLRHVNASQHKHQASDCPPWTTDTGNNTCHCDNSLGGLVRCHNNNKTVSLPFCYCMAYSEYYNKTVVGYCNFRCHVSHRDPVRFKGQVRSYRYKVYNWTSNTSELNRYLCNDLNMNRDGQLCGHCMDGFAPPVYSYSIDCIKCSNSVFHNVLKYLAIAYLPLTVFYMLAILFRFSATSGAVNGFIFTSQFLIGIGQTFTTDDITNRDFTFKAVSSFYGIWNLDFFRSLYTQFCIHPSMTTLETLALEYGIAVYPLLLIILTYISVRLHDRYSVVVRLWKPFYYCFMKIRNEWDIKNSLIEMFTTFLLLSYVKILNTSFALLNPVTLTDNHGEQLPQLYLKDDATVEYFGRRHRPYAALALTMTIVFNLFPLLLLCLYPCKCFQKFLYVCKLQNRTLRTFMNMFQLMFKTHPRDYRCFAAFYLSLRIIPMLLLLEFKGGAFLPLGGILMMVVAVLISILRPYKVVWHNYVDTILLAILAFTFLAFPIWEYVKEFVFNDKDVKTVYQTILPLFLAFHPLYGVVLIIHTFIPKRTLQTITKSCTTVYQRLTKNNDSTTGPVPHRIAHPSDSEYAPLLDTASHGVQIQHDYT